MDKNNSEDLIESVPDLSFNQSVDQSNDNLHCQATLPDEECIMSFQNINLNPLKSNCDCVPGTLLHQCLSITSLKLLEGVVLVAAEGSSILVKNAYFDQERFGRYQIFPSQCIISGMEFISYPVLECGENPWSKMGNKPYDHVYVGFIWAGSSGAVVRITRSSKGCLKLLEYNERLRVPMKTTDFVIVAAKWLDGGNTLALLSVLNFVVLYERRENENSSFTELEELQRIKCLKSETLFSGTIFGTTRTNMRVFGGTIFNGICVWDIKDGSATIQHELKCHDGIVFSLEYYHNRQILLSTSDDRTVAVWKFETNSEGNEKVTLRQRFYGHDARVWKAVLVHNYVISMGESSDVRVNNLDGSEHKEWKAHDGSPIFTSIYDEDVNILYTGGGDGSIRKWPKWWYRLKPRILPFDVIPYNPDNDFSSIIQGSGRSSANKDFPKSVALLDLNHIIVAMESGRVIGMTWEGKQFDLMQDSRCEGYQIIKISPDHKILAMAGKDGHFFTSELRFSKNESSNADILYAKKLFMTKISSNILSLIWLDVSRLLIVCSKNATALLFQENEKGERSEATFIQSFNLNLQRPGVPAAVEIFGKYIVVADELGALHLLRYHKKNGAIQKLENVHKDGVSALLFHDSQLYSAGRDGLVKTFSLHINEEDDLKVELVALAVYQAPFEWISGIYFNIGQILLCGFQKEDFVVYSFNEKRALAKIPCGGGGNRKWDFKYGHGLEGSSNASFTFLKDKEILYTFLPMTGHLNTIMKEGMHSKTINCALQLTSLTENQNRINYITGSEDGSLRWFQWDVLNKKNLCIENMENHVSSVRAVASCSSDVSNQKIIFSGGGRSQLCIYLMDMDTGRMYSIKEIILVKTKCKQTEGDVRIMDISVIECKNNEVLCFSGCSDGFVRVLYFNTKTHKFKIAGVLNGNGHSVMRIQLLTNNFLSGQILICGITSNGYFIVWKWNNNSLNFSQSDFARILEINPDFVKLLRRTAFMSMQTKQIIKSDTDNEYLIICGGDDCSISCWTLIITKNDGEVIRYKIKENWTKDQTQRGAVVGVAQNNNKIYTISNDQIVGVWKPNGELESTYYAGVSDCQGFELDGMSNCVLCFGKGLSWIAV